MVHCSITYSSIRCISGKLQGRITTAESAEVVVVINSALINQNGVAFIYKKDPVFVSVAPNYIIPSCVFN